MSSARALVLGWAALWLNQAAHDGPHAGARQGPAPRKQVAVDRNGDPLPAGAVARLGTLRFRPDTTATALSFAPDGKHLAGVPFVSTNFLTSATAEKHNVASGAPGRV